MVVASSIGWWWMPYAIVGGESSSRATLSECIVPGGFRASHKRSPDIQEKDSSYYYKVIQSSSFKPYSFCTGFHSNWSRRFPRLGNERNCFWRLDSTRLNSESLSVSSDYVYTYRHYSIRRWLLRSLHYVRSRFMYRKRKLSVYTSVTYWNNVRIYPFQSYGIATKGRRRRLSAMLCDLSLSPSLSLPTSSTRHVATPSS